MNLDEFLANERTDSRCVPAASTLACEETHTCVIEAGIVTITMSLVTPLDAPPRGVRVESVKEPGKPPLGCTSEWIFDNAPAAECQR